MMTMTTGTTPLQLDKVKEVGIRKGEVHGILKVPKRPKTPLNNPTQGLQAPKIPGVKRYKNNH